MSVPLFVRLAITGVILILTGCAVESHAKYEGSSLARAGNGISIIGVVLILAAVWCAV